MSLADELLADLEDDNEEAKFTPVPEIKDEEMETEVPEDALKVVTLDQLVKTFDSVRLEKIVEDIQKYVGQIGPRIINGPVEADPEYQLIVEANNLAAEIDNEIIVIHRFVRDKYSKRFPELESLVVDPLEYLRTVKEVGNDLAQAKNNEVLQQFLTQATIMVVSVTASTTQGELLTDRELNEIVEACNMGINLNAKKLRIYEYVESRMSFIAPNLSAIIGASTAAKIMGVAGGLTNLSKMPACNVLLLGGQKKTLGGFSQVNALPHTGFIYHSQFVQDTPPDMRRKAARLVATKCTLAARVDACHEAKAGNIGMSLRQEIEKKLDKLMEPPPVKFVKPLPKPIDPARKKRGGKRVRKMKERYAMTELRKQQNRLNFAEEMAMRLEEPDGTHGARVSPSVTKVRAAYVRSLQEVCTPPSHKPTFPGTREKEVLGRVEAAAAAFDAAIAAPNPIFLTDICDLGVRNLINLAGIIPEWRVALLELEGTKQRAEQEKKARQAAEAEVCRMAGELATERVKNSQETTGTHEHMTTATSDPSDSSSSSSTSSDESSVMEIPETQLPPRAASTPQRPAAEPAASESADPQMIQGKPLTDLTPDKRTCPICFRSVPKLVIFRCTPCKEFWARLCRKHTRGRLDTRCERLHLPNDVTCSHCRRRRYELELTRLYPRRALPIPSITGFKCTVEDDGSW